MITIQRYDDTRREVWNTFVGSARNATFLFDRKYMEYHADRFRDHSVLVFDDDVLVALFPANQNQDGIVSHEGLSYGGLVLAYAARLESVLSYFFHLVRYYNENGFKQIRYKCFPLCLAASNAQEDLYALYLLDASLVRRDANAVLVRHEGVSYKKGKRYSIAKGSKQDYSIREAREPAGFWSNVLLPNLDERFGVVPTHSADEMRLLMNNFPSSIHLHEIVLDTIHAGALIFEMPAAIHIQYLAASPEGKANGALDVLLHELLTVTYSQKDTVSFGHSNEQHGRFLNRGLMAWKEGFGARTQVLDSYVINTDNFSALSSYA